MNPTETQKNRTWIIDLRAFLNGLLTNIFPDDGKRSKYLNNEAMKIWLLAFTHETFDADNNYEDLEYRGDAILKYVFVKYLMNRFPYYHKDNYTNLNNIYMSKLQQGTIAASINLNRHVRIGGWAKSTGSINTDLFESFFGALAEISDKILDGSAAAHCYNMIVFLFKSITIDPEAAKGSPKTQTEQIFTRFDQGKPREVVSGGSKEFIYKVTASPVLMQYMNISDPLIEKINGEDINNVKSVANEALVKIFKDIRLVSDSLESVENTVDRNIRFEIVLSNAQMDFLRSYNTNLESNVIGSGIALTKTEAKNIAYKNALDTLARAGISTEWAEKAKTQLDLMDDDIKLYMAAVNSRMQRDGIKEIKFSIPKKTYSNIQVQILLLGIGYDNKEKIIASTVMDSQNDGIKSGKISVIRQYASGQ